MVLFQNVVLKLQEEDGDEDKVKRISTCKYRISAQNKNLKL